MFTTALALLFLVKYVIFVLSVPNMQLKYLKYHLCYDFILTILLDSASTQFQCGVSSTNRMDEIFPANGRIVGGANAFSHRWPWQVSYHFN